LIVDRSIKPKSSNIIIADVDGEWMSRPVQARLSEKAPVREPLNEPIMPGEEQKPVIFGVVTYVINEANYACLCID
jgi:DNA polymerase V